MLSGQAPRAPRAVQVALAAILALTAAVYARSLRGAFQLDDRSSVVENPAVKDLTAFLRGGFWAELRGAGRPLTTLTFAVDHAISGLSPLAFHLTSVAVHLAVVLLVFAFTRRVLQLAGAARADGVALFVAAAFALHPIETEAVSYVAQRSESLASGLYLATLLLLLDADRQGFRGRGLVPWAGAVVAFAAALAAKAIAITAPVAYVLLVLAVPSREERERLASWRRRALALAPLGALAAGFAALTLLSIRGSPDAGFSVAVAPRSYPLTELRAMARYLRLLAWPAGQSADPDFPPSVRFTEPAVVASAALVAALLAGAAVLVVRGRRGNSPGAAAARIGGLGIAWFFLVLSVTSSVVPLADPVAEHRVYLAAWGVLVAVAVAVERLAAASRAPQAPQAGQAAVAAAVVACLALAAVTWARNAVWETPLAFWRDAVAKAPGRARPHLGLAYAIATGGDVEAALPEYRTALALARGLDAPQRMPVLAQLGGALVLAGRLDEAGEVLRHGVEENPADPTTLYNAATLRLRLGDLDGAQALVERALAVAPAYADAHALVGEILVRRMRPADGLREIEQAIRLDPDRPARRVWLGIALGASGRLDEACTTLGGLAGRSDAAGRDARTMLARFGCAAPAAAAR